MKKTILKTASFILALTMLVCTAAGCSSSNVITLEEDGKEYGVTLDEYLTFMRVVKLNLFLNNVWSKSVDENIWKTMATDTQTYEEYYSEYVKDLAVTAVIEKYLCDKYDLKISDEKMAELKKSIGDSNSSYGGAGSYKQYFGYTAHDYYMYYQMAVERSNLILDYLYEGENAVTPITDEEREAYYNEKYEAFQFIYLNMNYKVAKDDDGHYIGLDSSSNEYTLSVDIDDNGAVKIEILGKVGDENADLSKVTVTSFKTVELTDEEKEEKASLPDEIIKLLDGKNGANFKELMLKYSDLYLSYKYEDGMIISEMGYIVNNNDVMDPARALEIDEYTKAISVSDGAYYYIVKKVEKPEKAYKESKYADLFTNFEDGVTDYEYGKVLDEYRESVVIDTDTLSQYTMADRYLSDYVDYYYNLIKSLMGGN